MNLSEFIQSPESNSPHYMVVGNPISHSYSPIMHNRALEYYSLTGHYYPIKLEENELTKFIAHVNDEAFLGANITIPYKQWLCEVVDELTEEANAIGAINTIFKKDGKVIGHNTDSYGFLEPLHEYWDDLPGESCIIFGTGGATKAIIHALQSLGVSEVILVSRTPKAGQDTGKLKYVSYDAWEYYAQDCALIVNATPLGMSPDIASSPVREEQEVLLNGKICYDIVYNPEDTLFLRQAKAQNAIVIGGLDMLIYQGSKAFEIWTGNPFPIPSIREELQRVIYGA